MYELTAPENQYRHVPQELLTRQQWVCYTLAPRGDRMDKLPVDPNTGGMAKSNDPNTWGSFHQALAGVEKFGAVGVGIMFAGGVCGVDVDHCVDGGELDAAARDIVETLQSYTEISPSGTGVHVLCLGKLPPAEEGRRRGSVEMYDTARFFTVTGNALLREDGTPDPLRDCTLELGLVHRKYIYRKPPEQLTLGQTSSAVSLGDRELLDRMFAGSGGERLHGLYLGNWQGYGIGDGSQSAADQAFCNALAFWFGRDLERMDRVFRSSGLMRPKWDRSVGSGQTYGQRTLERAAASCQDTYEPKTTAAKKSVVKQPEEKEPDRLEEPMPGEKSTKKRMGEVTISPDPRRYTLDDTGNAYRFRDAYYRDVKYNHVDKVWLVWDGTRWLEDQTGEVKRRADQLLLSMQEEADSQDSETLAKHVKRSRSNKNKEAFLREAQHLAGVYILPSSFDRFRSAINLQNGVLGLRDGILRPHNRDYYLSLMAGVAYDAVATCPTWLRFLADITLGDEELMAYLQRMVGYCLTGLTEEQCIFFLYGNGKNGKSTFLSTLTSLLGEYAKNTQPETVMLRDKGNSGARSDIARLRGARLVSTFEPNAGCKLDEGMVKQMTGEDALTARFLYKAEFEFRPEFKILMATNVKPTISGTDNGIWRRIKLIPFNAKITKEQQDRRLPDKLRAELPGILNWALRGAMDWYRYGLPPCRCIDEAVAEYRTEMDKVQQFVDECILSDPAGALQASVVYTVYRTWCAQRGERYPMGNNKFAAEFKRRFTARKTPQYIEYIGAALNDQGQRLRHLDLEHGMT